MILQNENIEIVNNMYYDTKKREQDKNCEEKDVIKKVNRKKTGTALSYGLILVGGIVIFFSFFQFKLYSIDDVSIMAILHFVILTCFTMIIVAILTQIVRTISIHETEKEYVPQNVYDEVDRRNEEWDFFKNQLSQDTTKFELSGSTLMITGLTYNGEPYSRKCYAKLRYKDLDADTVKIIPCNPLDNLENFEDEITFDIEHIQLILPTRYYKSGTSVTEA